MDMPGVEDRAILAAAFTGAVAYLCTQEKLPLVRAALYVLAGTATAYYIAPGIVEWLAAPKERGGLAVSLGERAKYAIVFATGVGGLWILHLITGFLQELRARLGAVITAFLNRFSSTQQPLTKNHRVENDTEPEQKGQP